MTNQLTSGVVGAWRSGYTLIYAPDFFIDFLTASKGLYIKSDM